MASEKQVSNNFRSSALWMSCVATWGGDDANPTPASLKTRNIPNLFLTYPIFQKTKNKENKPIHLNETLSLVRLTWENSYVRHPLTNLRYTFKICSNSECSMVTRTLISNGHELICLTTTNWAEHHTETLNNGNKRMKLVHCIS